MFIEGSSIAKSRQLQEFDRATERVLSYLDLVSVAPGDCLTVTGEGPSSKEGKIWHKQ